jgi:hypothetical protein
MTGLFGQVKVAQSVTKGNGKPSTITVTVAQGVSTLSLLMSLTTWVYMPSFTMLAQCFCIHNNRRLTMKKVFVVSSHVEVEKNNWSSMVLKAFTKLEHAQSFAQELGECAESNETIEVETIDLIGD